MCRLCTWSTIALFPGSPGGDQSEIYSFWRSNELSSYVHRFVGGGQAAFGPFLNSGEKENCHSSHGRVSSGIHTLMYFYYLCAALGPWMQPYLWWKKYLTTLQVTSSLAFAQKSFLTLSQLVQFVMVFFHAMQPIFFQCDFPLAARFFPSILSSRCFMKHLHFSLMFCGTGLQYFILFSAFYKKTYR